MIGISKLYCGTAGGSDHLRYAQTEGRKPVVVWNATLQCNLKCRHCYSASSSAAAPDELTTDEAIAMIDDLAAFKAPVLLFSGGEPMLRGDILRLIRHASVAGLRAVLSTNGTLITSKVAASLADAGLAYAGISLDGLEGVNDAFRGQSGAFQSALAGIRNCRAAGVRVGLRLTMNKSNVADIGGIFDLIERENIPRVCFYHLVATGRGGQLADVELGHDETRRTLDYIIDRTAALHAVGKNVEVLTVDNHADGPYVYIRLMHEDEQRAARCLQLLKLNRGNASGIGIGCVSWNGDVLPDQFWRQHVLGNVRSRRFSEIWSDPVQPLLAKLRDRRKYLRCRCMRCRFLDVCNGNFRARAEAATGDMWGDDPACYLTDEEIAP